MPTSKKAVNREVPPWALLTIAALVVLTLGYFGWRAFTGYEPAPGPPKKVYPGMYDLRAEAAKRSQAGAVGAFQNGPR